MTRVKSQQQPTKKTPGRKICRALVYAKELRSASRSLLEKMRRVLLEGRRFLWQKLDRPPIIGWKLKYPATSLV